MNLMASETEDVGMVVEWWLGFLDECCVRVTVGGWAVR